MSSNPYAPPMAEVADIVPSTPSSRLDEQPPFFAVSLVKLAVLSVCTLSLYELYWFYKNWKLIRARESSNILPFWRAFFAIFFCHACFARIRDHGDEQGVTPALPAAALATGWVVTMLLHKLPDPWWLVSFLSFLFMLPVQAYVNRVNAATAPAHDRNARFSVWNWLVTVLGGAFFLLAALGTLAGEK